MIMDPFSFSMLVLSVVFGIALSMFLVFQIRRAYDPRGEYGITYAEALRRMHSSLFSRDLMIFDFDDTLYPTAFMNATRLRSTQMSEFPEDLREQMAEIDESALAMIRDCWSRGTVKIVTNAHQTWIQARVRFRHMPRLFRFLRDKQITIVSASDTYAGTTEPKNWKVYTFRDLVAEFKARLWRTQEVRVLSVGDRENDRDATLALSNEPDRLVWGPELRFVMFRLSPSTVMLRDQLRVLRTRISSILNARQQVDISMANLMPNLPQSTE